MDEASQDAEIASLKVNVQHLQDRVRYLEKCNETGFETPLWKKLWFALDGWPLHRIAERRQWRPWHRGG